MAKPTVSAGYAKSLIDCAVSRGANRQLLLDRAQLNVDDLLDADNRLPLASFAALMSAGKDLCNDPAFPLHFGAAKNFDEISVVGLLCYSSATMGEALLAINRFGYLVLELDIPKDRERFQLIPEGDGIWLIDNRLNPNNFPELTEATWSRFISENARNFPNLPFAKEVHMTHPEPEHSAEYYRMMKVPVFFERERNAILIEKSWPSIKLKKPNDYVFGLLSAHAEKLLKDLERADTVRAQVESLLIPLLHNGDLGMSAIAKELGYSRQTLYRKLNREGTSYGELLDELRHKMALHYLSGKKASVMETAYLVGFSDPGAFSRAFIRWTGSRPSKVS